MFNICFIEYNSSLLFSKIVGGRRAKWQGNIHVVGIKCGNNYYGAGALISPKHVITSHQCVHTFQRPNFSNAYVAVGSLSSLNGTGHYFQDIIYGNADTEINFAIIYVSDSTKNNEAYIEKIVQEKLQNPR